VFLTERIGAMGWVLAVAAGLSRIVQTNHFEVQRRIYQWRIHGTDWVGSDSTETGQAGKTRFGWLVAPYLRLAAMLNPPLPRTDAALPRAAARPDDLCALRQMVRDEMALPLRRLSPLGSNQRTLALGVSMFLGTPLWYFLYEATLLNLALVLSMIRHRSAGLRLESRVAQASTSDNTLR